MTPNDPKLSERGGWRVTRWWAGKAAGSVARRVTASAFAELGVVRRHYHPLVHDRFIHKPLWISRH